jgi:hypothetical protein
MLLKRRTIVAQQQISLLYFGFLEFHMLTRDRVILAHHNLLGRRPWILFCHVIEAGTGGTEKFDFLRYRLGHDGPVSDLCSVNVV